MTSLMVVEDFVSCIRKDNTQFLLKKDCITGYKQEPDGTTTIFCYNVNATSNETLAEFFTRNYIAFDYLT